MDNKKIGFCVNNSDGTFNVYDEDGRFKARQLGQCTGWGGDYTVREHGGRRQALGFNGKTSFNF